MATDHKFLEHQFEYIRDAYKVPAKKGGRVTYTGGGAPKGGTITGAENGRVMILLDGETLPQPYHPKWELEYQDALQTVG